MKARRKYNQADFHLIIDRLSHHAVNPPILKLLHNKLKILIYKGQSKILNKQDRLIQSSREI